MSLNKTQFKWHSNIRIFMVIISMILVLCASANCLAYDVALNWEANTETDVIGYKVYYAVDSLDLPFAGTGLVNGVSPVEVSTQTSAIIRGLEQERTYYFAVVAYNIDGESPYSDILVTPLETTPPSLTVSNTIIQTVLSSQTISGTVSDNVQVSSVNVKVNGGAPVTAAIDGGSWTASITDLGIGDNSVVVTATDSSGNSTQKSLSITLYHVGPANNNGSPGISDALTVLQYVVGLKNPTTEELIRSDVSPIDVNTRQPKPNGKLDVSDALAMLRKVVGLSW